MWYGLTRWMMQSGTTRPFRPLRRARPPLHPPPRLQARVESQQCKCECVLCVIGSKGLVH